MSQNKDQAILIKQYYIEPPLKVIETDWYKKQGRHRSDWFEINTKIWVDQHLPEYRVVIPAKETHDGNGKTVFGEPLQTKFITYVPTGRVVYDNTGMTHKPVVYEYILESLLGKKDLVHK